MSFRNGPRKGSEFEREVCKLLSRWWTHGDRDDVFWRSSASGARAKQRSKTDQKTFGQYGDIQATDPIGQPLMNVVTIECKSGYGKANPFDMVDKCDKRHKPDYEAFLRQARADRTLAHVQSWMLIARRQGRCKMIYMPAFLAWKLITAKRIREKAPILMGMWFLPNIQEIRIQYTAKTARGISTLAMVGWRLDDFFANIEPQDFRDIDDETIRKKNGHE